MSDGLSRRSLLGSIAAVGGAGALGGAGSKAFLSDREEVANNRLVAGALDLRLAWRESYVGETADEALGAGTLSPADVLSAPVTTLEQYPDAAGANFETAGQDADTACASDAFADAPDDLDPRAEGSLRSLNDDTVDPATGGVRPLVRIRDAKPGDFGFTRFRLLLCDNDAYVNATGGIRSLEENDLTEPERKDPDQPTGAGATAAGQLADEIRVRLYQDRTGGAAASVFEGLDASLSRQELSEAVFDVFELRTAPTLREFSAALSVGLPLDGNPFDGDGPGSTMAGNPDLFLYDLPAAVAGDTERSCFRADDATGQVGIIFALPVDHANEIQTDAVTVDVGFEAVQCRHNDGETSAEAVDVGIENVSADPAMELSPGVLSVHDENHLQVVSTPIFQPGGAAGEPMMALVDEDDPMPLLAALSADDVDDRVDTFGRRPDEVASEGPRVGPGEAYQFPVYAAPGKYPVDLGFAVPVAGQGMFLGPGDGVTLADHDGFTEGDVTDRVGLWTVNDDGHVVSADPAALGAGSMTDLVRVTVEPL